MSAICCVSLFRSGDGGWVEWSRTWDWELSLSFQERGVCDDELLCLYVGRENVSQPFPVRIACFIVIPVAMVEPALRCPHPSTSPRLHFPSRVELRSTHVDIANTDTPRHDCGGRLISATLGEEMMSLEICSFRWCLLAKFG